MTGDRVPQGIRDRIAGRFPSRAPGRAGNTEGRSPGASLGLARPSNPGPVSPATSIGTTPTPPGTRGWSSRTSGRRAPSSSPPVKVGTGSVTVAPGCGVPLSGSFEGEVDTSAMGVNVSSATGTPLSLAT